LGGDSSDGSALRGYARSAIPDPHSADVISVYSSCSLIARHVPTAPLLDNPGHLLPSPGTHVVSFVAVAISSQFW